MYKVQNKPEEDNPQLEESRQQCKDERRRLKSEFGDLFDKVSAILLCDDPVGINFGDNVDEYEPEARTIISRLRACRSVDEVRRMIHQEFVNWFDLETAGPEERYGAVANEIWAVWQDQVENLGAGKH